MRTTHALALTGVAAILLGCSQPEPDFVRPQPMFDKFGGGTCSEGYVYVPGTVPEFSECIPEDDCEEYTDASGQTLPCPPPPPNRPDDEDDRGRSPNTPGAAGGARG